MPTLSIRAITLMVLLCCAVSMLAAQTSPLPGTTPAPGDPPATTNPDEEDPSLAPPTATPTLPSTARRSSLMVKRGDMELEWRASYSHFSKSSLFVDGVAMLPVLVVGEVAVERVRRDILINSISARYGLADNLQGELRVPFRFQFERRAIPEANPPQDRTLSAFGLGDIEGAVYYQLPQRSSDSIRWIVNAGIKSDTGSDIFEVDPNNDIPLGTGFWSTKLGISGVKVSDPAALYWNFGYTYNWERRNIRIVTEDETTGDPIVNFVNIKPGNTIDVGGGIAYALNPRLSMNTGMSVSFGGSSTSNGAELANTALTSASLRFGAVWVTESMRPIDLSISVGLTEDSPDFTLEFRRVFKL